MIRMLLLVCLFTNLCQAQDCYEQIQAAFDSKGAYLVTDGMHENANIVLLSEDGPACILGKAYVSGGKVASFYLQYEDGSYQKFDKSFYNAQRQQPVITNGASELMYTPDRETFKIFFLDALKP